MRRFLIRPWPTLAGLAVLAMLSLTVFIINTSQPELPTVLPTATAQPAADPNVQVLAVVNSGNYPDWAALHLHYDGSRRNGDAGLECASDGRWSLEVNPQDIVGHPYSSSPALPDWKRAAQVVADVVSICPVPVVLNWVGHDPHRPQSDRWSAELPSEQAGLLDGVSLRAFAAQHAQQQ